MAFTTTATNRHMTMTTRYVSAKLVIDTLCCIVVNIQYVIVLTRRLFDVTIVDTSSIRLTNADITDMPSCVCGSRLRSMALNDAYGCMACHVVDCMWRTAELVWRSCIDAGCDA